eukprot:4357964-Pleurochrysis_carterae.AAC.3
MRIGISREDPPKEKERIVETRARPLSLSCSVSAPARGRSRGETTSMSEGLSGVCSSDAGDARSKHLRAHAPSPKRRQKRDQRLDARSTAHAQHTAQAAPQAEHRMASNAPRRCPKRMNRLNVDCETRRLRSASKDAMLTSSKA